MRLLRGSWAAGGRRCVRHRLLDETSSSDRCYVQLRHHPAARLILAPPLRATGQAHLASTTVCTRECIGVG